MMRLACTAALAIACTLSMTGCQREPKRLSERVRRPEAQPACDKEWHMMDITENIVDSDVVTTNLDGLHTVSPFEVAWYSEYQGPGEKQAIGLHSAIRHASLIIVYPSDAANKQLHTTTSSASIVLMRHSADANQCDIEKLWLKEISGLDKSHLPEYPLAGVISVVHNGGRASKITVDAQSEVAVTVQVEALQVEERLLRGQIESLESQLAVDRDNDIVASALSRSRARLADIQHLQEVEDRKPAIVRGSFTISARRKPLINIKPL